MLTDAQRAAIDAAASDRLTLANHLQPLLRIDGVPMEGPDIRDLVAGGSDGRTVEAGDEPGVELTATIAGSIEARGQRVEMDFDVDGTVVPGFRGRMRARTSALGATTVYAETGAYHWSRSPLRTVVAPLNTPRNIVLFSALSALQQAYDGVQIPASIAEPPMTLQGSDSLGEWSYISDVVDAVEGTDDARICRVLDTALNVATAYPVAPVEANADPVWEFREGEDCDFGAVEVSEVDEERYYAVVAKRQLEDGTQETLAEVRIDNGDVFVSPTDILVLESTDQTQETDSPQVPAHVIAFNEAMRRGRDAVKLTVPCCYWPFWLNRGDVAAVETREFTDEGSVNRRYLFRIDGFLWGPSRAEGQVSGEGIKVAEWSG